MTTIRHRSVLTGGTETPAWVRPALRAEDGDGQQSRATRAGATCWVESGTVGPVGRRARRLVVVSLNGLCNLVDRFAYHPAVIRATRVLPRWWRCDLGRLAVLLDDKWESGTGGTIPAPSAAMDAQRPRQTDLVLGPLHALGCYTVKEAMPISTR